MKRLGIVFLIACMTVGGMHLTASAAGQNETNVMINETNFPDESFRSYVQDDLDIDQNGELSPEEIQKVTSLSFLYSNIVSLKGIEYFTDLTKLEFISSELTSLDVSGNTA